MLSRRFASPTRRASRFAIRRGAVAMSALLLGAGVLLSGCSTLPPQVMVSTGDSITRGFDACGLLTDCTQVSYATGTSPGSDSIYRHLLATNPRLVADNDAEVGARASDLYSQMSLAIWQRADVVTVLIGSNDACADTVGDMTPVADFRSSIQQAFGLFFGSRPGARIVLSSIPNLYRVWQVAHTNARARAIWSAASICPSMLANPASLAQGDQLRRVLVTLQIQKYNAALAAVCKAYRGCRWDGGALGRYQFTLSDLSKYDYFHPAPQGHRALGALSWTAFKDLK